jgi:hypothetical protein
MILLVVILLVLGIFLGRDYFILRREQIINAREMALSGFLKSRGPLTASDVTVIRPWMTFAYINKLFNVSSTYLQNTLSIKDPSYPQLSLGGYANYEHENAVLVTAAVESALSVHLTSISTASNTSSTNTATTTY